MSDVDWGNEALCSLRALLGVDGESVASTGSFQWSLWGTQQYAWSERATGAEGRPLWRVHLRTCAVEGYTGTPAQGLALSASLPPPTLACVVRSADRPGRIQLASSLDMNRGDLRWCLKVLTVAARVQALGARQLSLSKGLGWVGLSRSVDVTADVPDGLAVRPDETLLGDLGAETGGPASPEPELSGCIEALKAQAGAHAVRTPWGVSALVQADGATGMGSLIEASTDAEHPMLGRGFSILLRTPIRGTTLDAVVANEREIGPRYPGDVLGGWWASPEDLICHSCFYPNALYQGGLARQLLLAAARRAQQVRRNR